MRETRVETNEVRKGQRPHRVVHPAAARMVSTASAVATPSADGRTSPRFSIGHQDPVRDEARKVPAFDRRLPHLLASATTAAAVSSDVAIPRITSTSAITGTGFMKCIPMNFSGATWRPRGA